MRKKIALCMVVKNEEKGLKRAVDSARPFVSDVHIAVDNSSSDNTFEIARECGDIVRSFFWSDSFSEARNLVANDVEADYILFIDGHERVESYAELQKALATNPDVVYCKIRMDNGFEFSAPRIYKTGLQFHGAVHEGLKFDTKFILDTFVIVHDRLGSQDPKSAEIREIQRDDQIPRIMIPQLKLNPADIRASFHLMLYYSARADHKKSLYYSKKYLNYSKDKGQRWYVFYNRALSFMAKGHSFRAWLNICRAESEEPDRWETEKIKGLILFEGRKYQKALKHLVESFNLNKEHHVYCPLPRDDAGTWNLIGECFLNLGILDKASVAFENASDRSSNEMQKKFFAKRASLMLEMIKGS